jgi:hypothetical protein
MQNDTPLRRPSQQPGVEDRFSREGRGMSLLEKRRVSVKSAAILELRLHLNLNA